MVILGVGQISGKPEFQIRFLLLMRAKILVVVFMCNHCPTAQYYEERLKQIVSDYKPKGVALDGRTSVLDCGDGAERSRRFRMIANAARRSKPKR